MYRSPAQRAKLSKTRQTIRPVLPQIPALSEAPLHCRGTYVYTAMRFSSESFWYWQVIGLATH